jgi:uncharacterized membrane protein YeaQ/YmgE (transglycosylase-associated protein family)
MGLIVAIIIGAIAGLVAQAITKVSADVTKAPNWLENIVLGIIGAFVGGWLLGLAGVNTDQNIVLQILGAILGSAIVLWVYAWIKGLSSRNRY